MKVYKRLGPNDVIQKGDEYKIGTGWHEFELSIGKKFKNSGPYHAFALGLNVLARREVKNYHGKVSKEMPRSLSKTAH